MRHECLPSISSERLATLVKDLRARIEDVAFLRRHRRDEKSFTRRRRLPFGVVMILLLQKTVKSIQRHLHEYLAGLVDGPARGPLTGGAWTQARAKFCHTAFIELNEQCVLPTLYDGEAGAIGRWKGHRVLGMDSSILRLPNAQEVGQRFGWVKNSNQSGATGVSPEGRMSVVYDVLNRMGLDARLVSSKRGEIELAIEQLSVLKPGDLCLLDRGFTGFEMLARICHQGQDFVARCSTASFGPSQEMFANDVAGVSRTVTIRACRAQQQNMRELGIPMELVMRFVSVRLSTGELEVLVTSLCDEEKYPTECFAHLYHQRWGIETYYLMLKSRLDLENWTGQTAEAVCQDFHASVLLANLESLLTRSAQEVLTQRKTPQAHEQRVNRSVSYHALKCRLFDLLLSDVPADQVVSELTQLFTANAVSRRQERKIPRTKASLARSLYFQRHQRKNVY